MPKTASTSMQKLLRDNENVISDLFYIPKSCQISKEIVNHANLFFELVNDTRFNSKLGTFSDLINEIRNKKKNIILSSEDFSFLLLDKNLKTLFENSLSNLNFQVTYICFFRNETSYFFSTLKELKRHRLNQQIPNNKFSYLHDLIHFKNALLHGYVFNNLNNEKNNYKIFFNIKKFSKLIEKDSIFKFKYFKHDKNSLMKFGKIFNIQNFNLRNYQLNVVHKRNLKNYLYSIPGFIIYLLYKRKIKEDNIKYILSD